MSIPDQGEGVRKGSFYMLIALSITGVSLFLFNVLAARSIGKSEFGKLGVFYSLFSFIASFLASGFRDLIAVTIPGIREKKTLNKFLEKTFSSFLFYFIIFYILVWVLSPAFIQRFFDTQITSFSLFSLCFIFLFSLMFTRGILLGFRKISYVAISHSIYGILILITGIFFYLTSGRLFHFESAYLFSLLIPIPVTIYLLKKISPLKLNFNLKNIISPWNPLLMSTINSILEAYFYIGILLMKIKNSPYSEIGLFNATLTFFMGVKTFYSAIFMPLLPNLSYAISKKDKRLFIHYIKRIGILIMLTLIILLILSSTFLPSLWNMIFGKGFYFQKIDFILISIIISLYLLLRLFSRAFFAIKEINYIFFSFIIFTVLLALLFFLSPLSPIISIEISFLLSSFITLLFLYLRIYRTLSQT